jgi:DNA-binding IclR family transcriptional regulator
VPRLLRPQTANGKQDHAELKIPRTTVTRLLKRMEKAGVVGREGNGYCIKELPNLAQGMQHWVRVVLRAAKELTKVGQQKTA